MVKENLNSGSKSAIKKYLLFLLLSVFLIFISLALFSAITLLFNIDKKVIPLFSVLSLCLGSFVGAFLSGKTFGSKALIVGGINGILLYVLVSITAVIINGGKITLSSLFNLLIILLSSVIGAIFGVNSANKRKIK